MVKSDVSLRVSDAISVDDRIRLEQMLEAYNIHSTGYNDARSLSINAHAESGAFLGGLQGYTWGGYCEIQTVFVPESGRRQGTGRLLMKAAEAEAILRGCKRIVLSTHGLHNLAFYENLGFRLAGRVEDCPIDGHYLLLDKPLLSGLEEVGTTRAAGALAS